VKKRERLAKYEGYNAAFKSTISVNGKLLVRILPENPYLNWRQRKQWERGRRIGFRRIMKQFASHFKPGDTISILRNNHTYAQAIIIGKPYLADAPYIKVKYHDGDVSTIALIPQK
jgi:hypothetical protein